MPLQSQPVVWGNQPLGTSPCRLTLYFVLGKMTAKNRRPSTHIEFEVNAPISKIIERVDNEVSCQSTGWRDNSQ